MQERIRSLTAFLRLKKVRAIKELCANLRAFNSFRCLALQLLLLHCMTLTPETLTEYEQRLRTEIVERECVLAAFTVLRSYDANGQWPKSLDLGPVAMRILSPMQEVPTTAAALPAPASQPVAPPPWTPPPRKIIPELEKLLNLHGRDSRLVQWAIARMTHDFSLTDIAALLKREDYPVENSKISVVLTRLKGRGEIQEIKPGSGPNPAVFRKPENPIPLVNEAADQISAS
jgi:hypothetical protein